MDASRCLSNMSNAAIPICKMNICTKHILQSALHLTSKYPLRKYANAK